MSQPTILVINDAAEVADVIAELLAIYGEYHTVTAYDGETALELVLSEQPALIIVDNIMRYPDGYEVCRTVRANPLTSAIPIIMTLHPGIPVYEKRGRAAGADEFVYYPFDSYDLLRRVKAILARGPSVEQ
jgi:CheY-like chemotaxis protein